MLGLERRGGVVQMCRLDSRRLDSIAQAAQRHLGVQRAAANHPVRRQQLQAGVSLRHHVHQDVLMRVASRARSTGLDQ